MSDTISLRRFARDASSLTQPTQVRQGDDILGTFTPKGWFDPASFNPTSRSAPVIPSGSLVVGTAETDQAQIGTPERTPGAVTDPAPASGSVPASHEPGGVQNAASSGSSPWPADPLEAVGPRRGVITGELLPRQIIPPKPAGYIHDPHFNSKGSRPAPKVRK